MPAEFPKVALEVALAFPNALIRAGGQSLDKVDMAAALDISPGSSGLRTQGFASSAYGLTGGSYKTSFSMGSLGEAIVSPTSPEEQYEALISASLKPELFAKLFEAYKGKKYPEVQFLVSALKRNFDVAHGQAEACAEVFTKNMLFVGLLRETKGGL